MAAETVVVASTVCVPGDFSLIVYAPIGNVPLKGDNAVEDGLFPIYD